MTTVPSTSNGTNSTGTSASSSSTGKSNTLDYDDFLRLLVAQLQNQDPTNPSDPTQFVSQLASFSAVEQQINANSKLDALLTQAELSQGAFFIGQKIASSDGSVSGTVASVSVTSSGVTATLSNGATLTLGDGITIS